MEPVGANRVFPTDPGVHGYLLATVSAQLGNLVLLVWVAGAAILSGRMAYLAGRTAYRVAAAHSSPWNKVVGGLTPVEGVRI